MSERGLHRLAVLQPSIAVRSIERLIRDAHWYAVRDERRAANLAQRAVRLTRLLHGWSRIPIARLMYLEAEALRELSDALMRCCRPGDAYRAAMQSKRLFDDPRVRPLAELNRIRLGMSIGYLHFLLDRTDEAFATMAAAAEAWRSRGDLTGWAKARTTIGGMHIQLSDYATAMDILDDALRASYKRIEAPALGAIAFNVATCAASLGDEARAEECYRYALQILREEGMDTDAIRAQTLHAKQLRLKGRLAESLAEYHQIRAELLSREHIEWAATITVTIMEICLENQQAKEALLLGRAALGILEGAEYEREAAAVREMLGRCG